MLDHLETEGVNPLTHNIDRLSTIDLVRLVLNEDSKVVQALLSEAGNIASAIEAIANRLGSGGRLFYIGAGTSGRLGVLDASECSPTYNTPPDMVQGVMAGGERALAHATEASEDDPESGIADLRHRGATAKDAVCGIAASGRTPYVLGAVRWARSQGALTVGISCVTASQLAAAVDIAISPVTGPEVITGSTRMKAGTATKLALNLISTGVMIRLGMTYGNLMVNVQPKNEKLLHRARRIVAQAAGVSLDEAASLLESAGNSVRTAIVMARLGLGREQAEARLAACGNVVARALGEN